MAEVPQPPPTARQRRNKQTLSEKINVDAQGSSSCNDKQASTATVWARLQGSQPSTSLGPTRTSLQVRKTQRPWAAWPVHQVLVCVNSRALGPQVRRGTHGYAQSSPPAPARGQAAAATHSGEFSTDLHFCRTTRCTVSSAGHTVTAHSSSTKRVGLSIYWFKTTTPGRERQVHLNLAQTSHWVLPKVTSAEAINALHAAPAQMPFSVTQLSNHTVNYTFIKAYVPYN